MKRMFLSLLSACSMVVGTSGHAQIPGSYRLIGPIGPGIIEFVQTELAQLEKDRVKPRLFMISYSPGGDVISLLRLVDIVNAHSDVVFVSGECLSACAEFLYLVNKPIVAAKNAKIGFHGDALTANYLVQPLHLPGKFECFDQRAEKFTELLKTRGANAEDGTRAMLARLQFYAAKEVPSHLNDRCRNADFSSRYRMWFPTTAQMQSILQMKIRGPVCADSEDCIKDFATKRWGPKLDIVVGDRIY